jgi:hypothetical protein
MTNFTDFTKDFTKDFSEIMNKNLELMTKYCKAATEQGEATVKNNVDNYFTYLEKNITTMKDVWETAVKDNKELQGFYNDKMTKSYNSFKNLYKETVEKYSTTNNG